MRSPLTAREALIAEALGEIALLLDRVESVTTSMEASRLVIASATADLDQRLLAFEGGVAQLTDHAKARLVDHIVRRTGEATRESIETQAQAMNAAARLAFSAQVNSELTRLSTTLQRLLRRADGPWERWLTHAATAAASAAVTSWIVGSPVFR